MEKPPKPDNGIDSQPIDWPKWIMLVGGSLGAYSHVFGYGFLKGLLSTSGFTNIEISISISESIYQTAIGLTHWIINLFKSGIFTKIISENWALSVLVFVVLVLLFFAKRYIIAKPIINQSRIQDYKKWLWSEELTFQIALSFFGSIAFIILQYLFVIVLMAVLFMLWLVLTIGILIGEEQGKKLVIENPCTTQNIVNIKSPAISSCTTIQLNDGRSLSGYRVFSNEMASYLLTSDGAYVISQEGRIVQSNKLMN